MRHNSPGLAMVGPRLDSITSQKKLVLRTNLPWKISALRAVMLGIRLARGLADCATS